MSLNEFVYVTSIRNLGVLNFQREKLTGEKDFVQKLLSRHDSSDFSVIDVGANVGEFAKFVLDQTNQINLISFEPNLVPFNLLREISARDSFRFEAINSAVSDFSGTVELIVDDSRPYGGFSTIHSEVHSESDPKIRRVRVAVTSLDEFFENQKSLQVALLKIDVEGHEKKVLIGAKFLIDKFKPRAILFEFNYMHIMSNTSLTELMALIGNKYEFFRLLPKGELYPLKGKQIWLQEIYAFQNIVCLLKDTKREQLASKSPVS